MSIVVESCNGWLLCHKTLIDSFNKKCYHITPLSTKVYCLKFRDVFFALNVPLVMDSEAVKISKQEGCTFEKPVFKKKRQRTESERLCDDYHSQIEKYISSSVDELVKLGKEAGYLETEVPTALEWMDNNKSARSSGKKYGQLNRMLDVCSNSKELILSSDFHITKLKTVDELDDETVNFGIEYAGSVPRCISFHNESFIIPPQCTFILSDIVNVEYLIKIGKKYDVILLDPPWENKSVKRKKGYKMLPQNNLLEIPISQLGNPGCLIVVWTTNNQNQMSFVKNKLFPQWSVTHCADWHWIKITRKGAYVHPLKSLHKKPYENLILGRMLCNSVPQSLQNSSNKVIENHKILVSVPSSIHSHKPPLTEVLKPYVDENAQCLELFARYLLPGWTSCGNEVLRLQHWDLYCVSEECENNCPCEEI